MTQRVVILCGRTRESRRIATRSVQQDGQQLRPDFLYITGGKRKADLIIESFWRNPGRRPLFLPEVEVWGQLRRKLCDRFGGDCVELPALAEDLLVGRLWAGLAPSMKRWHQLPNSERARQGLRKLIDDWQQSFAGLQSPDPGESPAALLFAGDGQTAASSLHPDLRHDLWLLLKNWQTLLRQNAAYTDRATASRSLLRRLSERPLQPALAGYLSSFSSLIVDDILWLSPLDRALLDALIDAFLEASPDGQVRLCLECGRNAQGQLRDFVSGAEQGPAALYQRASLALRRHWYQRVSEQQALIQWAPSTDDRADLSDVLTGDHWLPSMPQTGAIRLRHYGSELSEVRAIARNLKCALSNGLQPRDCVVAFPALDPYLPVIRRCFSEYGLPFIIERGKPLAMSPPISAARLLLKIAAKGGGRKELRSLLASGWIQWQQVSKQTDIDELLEIAFPNGPEVEERDREALKQALTVSIGAQPCVTARLQELHSSLVEAGCEWGSPLSWFSTLAQRKRRRLLRELERKPPELHPQLWSQHWDSIARTLRELKALNSLYSRILQLRNGTEPATAAAAIKGLLHEAKTHLKAEPQACDDPLLQHAGHDAQAALQRFDELLDELVLSTTMSSSIQPEAQQRSGVESLQDLVELAIDDCHYHLAKDTEAISITGLRDLRGVDIPWLWLGGAVEGELPRAETASFLLPPAAANLIETRDPRAEDRALFLSLLRNFDHGAARGKGFLCISTPATIADKEVSPSSLVLELRALRVCPVEQHDAPPAKSEPVKELAHHWQQLQSTEEQSLPKWLCKHELLSDPELDTEQLQLLSAESKLWIEQHRQLQNERSSALGYGRWDAVLGLGTEHREKSLEWLRTRLGGEPQGHELRLPATALEAWVRCPMRFFFSRVLNASEVSGWSPEPEPSTQGILLHRILERFFQERIQATAAGKLARSGLAGCSPQQIIDIKQRLLDISLEEAELLLDEVQPRYRAELVRRLTAGLASQPDSNASFTGRLARFVDEEVEEFLGLNPIATELAFPTFEPGRIAQQLDGSPNQTCGDYRILISGVIDRVDAAPHDRPGRGGALHGVYDYKTGKVEPLKSVDKGLKLQPVLYAAAIAPTQLGQTVSGYRQLPEQDESGRRRMIGSPTALAALKREVAGFGRQALPIEAELWPLLLRRADWYGQLIADGIFPSALIDEKEAGCSNCEFRRACRQDQRRATDQRQSGDSAHLDFLPRGLPASALLAQLRKQDEEQEGLEG